MASWLFDKKFQTDVGKIVNRFWWVGFVVGVIYAPKPKLTYSFSCNKLIIYNKSRFQDVINKKANEIIKELKISFDDNSPGIKFEDVSLTSVGILAINKLNKNCINPNKILYSKESTGTLPNLSEEEKILYFIIGIEAYERIKDLNFGSITFSSEKTKQWEMEKWPEQLKRYREFLELSEDYLPKVESAYEQLMTKGRFP